MGGLNNLGSNTKSNSLLDRIAYVSDIRIKGDFRRFSTKMNPKLVSDFLNPLNPLFQRGNYKPFIHNDL